MFLVCLFVVVFGCWLFVVVVVVVVVVVAVAVVAAAAVAGFSARWGVAFYFSLNIK